MYTRLAKRPVTRPLRASRMVRLAVLVAGAIGSAGGPAAAQGHREGADADPAHTDPCLTRPGCFGRIDLDAAEIAWRGELDGFHDVGCWSTRLRNDSIVRCAAAVESGSGNTSAER